jgi:presenilin-like A22 family membrane protease
LMKNAWQAGGRGSVPRPRWLSFREIMKSRLNPFLWGGATIIAGLALTLSVAPRQKEYVEVNQITTPSVSAGPGIAYFFGVVAVMALVLFIIPLRRLRLVFQLLFALMFAWGVFIITFLTLPYPAAIPLAIIAGLAWLFWARVWLHNLVLLIALAAAGSVFGSLFSPWAFLVLMIVIAVYDFLAVRFGFMVWMVDRLSQTVALPAFIYPRKIKEWALGLKSVRVEELAEKPADEREYSILGGGDIGFPLMLTASVYFASGLNDAMLVGAFGLAGLMAAFLIQMVWLKGKPMPALPPIAFFSLIGFLIAQYGLA